MTNSRSRPQAENLAQSVNAGKPETFETVDFSDPSRGKTCLEVDFPILPINRISAIEGNAGKPIYQLAKWWARRRSSVFRAMLLSAATKAPTSNLPADKKIWDAYYANHQNKAAFRHLKIADIFMGGGTTLVEASRLGMQPYGNDLNPVAWFVVKSAFAKVTKTEVDALLQDIEAEVRPKIAPYFSCSCPRGHLSRWTQLSNGLNMSAEFDPLTLPVQDRQDYRYFGPEIIYSFWVKHVPCSVTGCEHRTPLFSSSLLTSKTLTARAWLNRTCKSCKCEFDIEEKDYRIAPGAEFVIQPSETPFAFIDPVKGIICPSCSAPQSPSLCDGPVTRKKIVLSVLIHPNWLSGAPGKAPDGTEYGGSATDLPGPTSLWNDIRTASSQLIEVRGELEDSVTLPDGITVEVANSTVKARGKFACGSCGVLQGWTDSLQKSNKNAPLACFMIQGFCPDCESQGAPNGGRYFVVPTTNAINAAHDEWSQRSSSDLAAYWPTSAIPFGHETHQRQPLPQHGYTHYWKMFNPRQLLVLSQLLKAVCTTGESRHSAETRQYILAAFQQYLRNQNMFCFWNPQADKLEPHFSGNNYHPKATLVENGVFASIGRGNWTSCNEALVEALEWADDPWEIAEASNDGSKKTGRSEKVKCGDPLQRNVTLTCGSATELASIDDNAIDLVITDPPFGDNIQYSELADFFYVWLRLALKDSYPQYFQPEYSPKAVEVVTNKARQPEDPDAFYQRLLTQCWSEAHRILKPGGILAFTFHHSEDEPWVAVLESLFEAGFYLEATYPIRSDESKGDGQFGSRKIEYDIIHVCRKRTEEPTRVSWAKMRRQVLDDVNQHAEILERHSKQGLPPADLQVIKRGKALEYYSRHYGKVFVDRDREFTVREALIGINQLLEEETSKLKDPPPPNAEPITRQFLRLFEGCTELPRDQMQKFLRGTTIAAEEFEQRGWCEDKQKVYHLTTPLTIAEKWHGRHRRSLTSDYDQAMVLIGACFEQSGINVAETLKNENFRPHPSLTALLEWHTRKGQTTQIRQAAIHALKIYKSWQQENPDEVRQLSLFVDQQGV